jgi:hypothetical protein
MTLTYEKGNFALQNGSFSVKECWAVLRNSINALVDLPIPIMVIPAHIQYRELNKIAVR